MSKKQELTEKHLLSNCLCTCQMRDPLNSKNIAQKFIIFLGISKQNKAK